MLIRYALPAGCGGPFSLANKIKQRLRGRAFMFPCPFVAFCLILFSDFAFAENPTGYVDGVNSSGVIYGWALDRAAPSSANRVELYVDGTSADNLIGSVVTNQLRADVNNKFNINGKHGFNFQLPKKWLDEKSHALYVFSHPIATGKANPKPVLIAGIETFSVDEPHIQLFKDTNFANGLRAFQYCKTFSGNTTFQIGDCLSYLNEFQASPYAGKLKPGFIVRTLPDIGAPVDSNKFWNVNEGLHTKQFRQTSQFTGLEKDHEEGVDLSEERFATAGVVRQFDSNGMLITTENNWTLRPNDPAYNNGVRIMRSLFSDRKGAVTAYFNTQNLVRNFAKDNGSEWKHDTWPHYLIEQNFKQSYDLANFNKVKFSMSVQLDYMRALNNENFEFVNPAFQAVFMLRLKSQPYLVLFLVAPLYETITAPLSRVDQFGQGILTLSRDFSYGGPIPADSKTYPISFEVKSAIDKLLHDAGIPNRADDYALVSFTVGWEIVGNFESRAHFSKFSLKAVK